MNDEQYEAIKMLLEEIKELLEKQTPSTPWTQPIYPIRPDKSKCPVCGLELSGVMGYSCSRTDCPVFPQITC